jgi:hypothetical protein
MVDSEKRPHGIKEFKDTVDRRGFFGRQRKDRSSRNTTKVQNKKQYVSGLKSIGVI